MIWTGDRLKGGLRLIDRVDNNHFDLVSDYQPTGDQPQAIQQLTAGIESGEKEQILVGGDRDREDLYNFERDCKGE